MGKLVSRWFADLEAALARGGPRKRRLLRMIWWVWGTAFDLRHRVSTTAREEGDPMAENRAYEAFVPWRLEWALPRSSVEPGDVFADVGSGKGRAALIAAARYPFSRVIGVEYAESLHLAAVKNLESYRGRHAPIELLNVDATQWTLPADVTVMFMANPLMGEKFQIFITGVREQLEARPRRFRAVYVNPQMHSMMLDAGFVLKGRSGRINVYEWNGSTRQGQDAEVAMSST